MSAEHFREERDRLNEKACLKLQKQGHGKSGLSLCPMTKRTNQKK
ncbi:MAG: hypothetical protein SOU94_07710 [Acidaminococcus sp.]|nr:hypothetical protein [Acidaminococcus sp.]MDY2739697.1 hypothetical protein [Acidaminococcus sp.]